MWSGCPWIEAWHLNHLVKPNKCSASLFLRWSQEASLTGTELGAHVGALCSDLRPVLMWLQHSDTRQRLKTCQEKGKERKWLQLRWNDQNLLLCGKKEVMVQQQGNVTWLRRLSGKWTASGGREALQWWIWCRQHACWAAAGTLTSATQLWLRCQRMDDRVCFYPSHKHAKIIDSILKALKRSSLYIWLSWVQLVLWTIKASESAV